MLLRDQHIQILQQDRMADRVKKTTGDLQLLVKVQRYTHLDLYATKKGWTVEAPPVGASGQDLAWWKEWRSLTVFLNPGPPKPDK